VSGKTLAVVVAYRPEPQLLSRLLHALAPQVDGGIIVNNGVDLALDDAALARLGFAVQHLGGNQGVAAALNTGFRWAQGQQAGQVVSFDQDSEPAPDMVQCLLAAQRHLAQLGAPVGAVGPRQIDRRTGRVADFFAPIRWHRRRVLPGAGEVLEVDHLITSGCLMPMSAWRSTGGFLDALFVDYVDIEWSLRARAQGLKLFAVGSAVLQHAIGDDVHHWRGRQISKHGPLRHYYLMRNGLYLQKLTYVPLAWKLPDLTQLVKKFVFFAVVSRPRGAHIRAMLRGVWHGVTTSPGSPPGK
jgi:rhamnosyltransferase